MVDAKAIVVVDDHPLYRSGVIRTLAEYGRFPVVGEGASADEAVALAEKHRPALALLDISMPGNGLEAVRRIRQACPKTRIIMLTVSETDDDIMEALDAGASGYVLKGVGAPELLAIVSRVAAGESYVSPGLAARLLVAMKSRGQPAPSAEEAPALTAREEQILKLVAEGLSNKEIGRRLDLQEKTVKYLHVDRFPEARRAQQGRGRPEGPRYVRQARRFVNGGWRCRCGSKSEPLCSFAPPSVLPDCQSPPFGGF
jgi:two-component system nitrate/nitrite response regulator NarL